MTFNRTKSFTCNLSFRSAEKSENKPRIVVNVEPQKEALGFLILWKLSVEEL